MAISRPAFTVGIEEEYLLVDRESRNLVADPSPTLMTELEDLLGQQVSPEFLRSQIEVGTKVCNNLGEAAANFGDEAQKAVEEMAAKMEEMRREQASSIVVPGQNPQGGSGLVGV